MVLTRQWDNLGRKEYSHDPKKPYSTTTRPQVRENPSTHSGRLSRLGCRLCGVGWLRGECRQTNADHARNRTNHRCTDDNHTRGVRLGQCFDNRSLHATNDSTRYHGDGLHDDAVWYYELSLANHEF